LEVGIFGGGFRRAEEQDRDDGCDSRSHFDGSGFCSCYGANFKAKVLGGGQNGSARGYVGMDGLKVHYQTRAP
jgi:hypothetical protein